MNRLDRLRRHVQYHGMVGLAAATVAAVVSIAAAVLAAPPAREFVVLVTTTDGKQVQGVVSGGSLTVQSTLGTREVDGRKLRVLSSAGMTLTDGTMFAGSVTIVSGSLQVQTDKGPVAVAGRTVQSVQSRGTYLSPSASPAGTGGGEPIESVILGRWQDSNGGSWEFLKDGTAVVQNMPFRYSLPDAQHVKIDMGSMGVGVTPGHQSGAGVMVGGFAVGRVYDVVSASQDRIVWRSQGNDMTLTRVR